MKRLAVARVSSGATLPFLCVCALLTHCRPTPPPDAAPADAASAAAPIASVAPSQAPAPSSAPSQAPSADVAPAAAPSASSPSAQMGSPLCAPGCASPAAAYSKLFPGPHACTKPSATFPDLLAAGVVAGESGCVSRGVIAGCCLRTPGEVAAEKFASWPAATVDTRKAQALAWAREIVFPFQTVLDAPTKDFLARNHPFSPPIAVGLPNGGVAVTVWLHERAGPSKREIYTAQNLRFSPTGVMERMAQIGEWVR